MTWKNLTLLFHLLQQQLLIVNQSLPRTQAARLKSRCPLYPLSFQCLGKSRGLLRTLFSGYTAVSWGSLLDLFFFPIFYDVNIPSSRIPTFHSLMEDSALHRDRQNNHRIIQLVSGQAGLQCGYHTPETSMVHGWKVSQSSWSRCFCDVNSGDVDPPASLQSMFHHGSQGPHR